MQHLVLLHIVLHTFLVFSFIHNDLKVALVGPKVDLTYEYQVKYGSEF